MEFVQAAWVPTQMIAECLPAGYESLKPGFLIGLFLAVVSCFRAVRYPGVVGRVSEPPRKRPGGVIFMQRAFVEAPISRQRLPDAVTARDSGRILPSRQRDGAIPQGRSGPAILPGRSPSRRDRTVCHQRPPSWPGIPASLPTSLKT